MECCHPNLKASSGRGQVNQGKSTLIYRSSVLGLVASWGFSNLCVFGVFYLFVGFFVCFKQDFIFKLVTDPFPNGSCLKHDTFYIEDYINF